MKRIFFFFLGITIACSTLAQTWKQKRIEVWGGVSVIQFYGDIGGTASSDNLYGLKDISIRSTRPGFNVGMSYRFEERIYLHVTNTFGILASSDKGSRNSSRNYAFHALADEIAVQGVFYLIKEKPNYYFEIMKKRGGLNRVNQPLSVYILGGLGGLFYNTVAKNELVGSPRFDNSNKTALVVPLGLGVKLAYNQKVSFGLEIGARYVFSDQIDGLTTRFSKFNDIYYVINFKAIYRLQKGKGLKQIFR